VSRVVLAYSGGLDTSVLLKKMILEGNEVIALTADLGESDGAAGDGAKAALEAVKAKALALGAYDAVMIDASRIQLHNLSFSLDKLAHASPSLKRDLIETAVAMVTDDGIVTPTEAELIRAIADSLACPMPMLG